MDVWNAGSTSFEDEHAHTNESNALHELKTWYNTYFVDLSDYNNNKYQDYLADVVWCNDISTTGLGYGTNSTTYGYNMRTYPTLTCTNTLSRYTSTDYAITNVASGAVYKMGLLTVDEVVYAGGSISDNSTFYLYENSSDYWWTMSAYYYDGSKSYVYVIHSEGRLSNGGWGVAYGQYIRPSISLKSSTIITLSGDGTSTNPYVVTGF